MQTKPLLALAAAALLAPLAACSEPASQEAESGSAAPAADMPAADALPEVVYYKLSDS